MDKEELRQNVKASRLEMNEAEVLEKSEAITAKLIDTVNWGSIKSMHCYIPISSLNEVNTWHLLKYVWQEYPRIVTAVSTARKLSKYEAVRISQATRWRGLLPTASVAMPRDFSYELVVVPTLAFDARGYRLGWGGGFYDRFLASQLNAQKIGLCFENGRLIKVPNEPYDVKLDKVITEEKIDKL